MLLAQPAGSFEVGLGALDQQRALDRFCSQAERLAGSLARALPRSVAFRCQALPRTASKWLIDMMLRCGNFQSYPVPRCRWALLTCSFAVCS